jgi:hypothetical protein
MDEYCKKHINADLFPGIDRNNLDLVMILEMIQYMFGSKYSTQDYIPTVKLMLHSNNVDVNAIDFDAHKQQINEYVNFFLDFMKKIKH